MTCGRGSLSPLRRLTHALLLRTRRPASQQDDRLAVVVDAPARPLKGPPEPHDGGDEAVDAIGGLLLARFETAGGVGLDGDVRGHPTQDWVPAVA